MKILVCSDSHSSRSFLRMAVDAVKPDLILHLGDHYEDGEVLHKCYPHIPMYQVAGNCDRYRCPPWAAETLTIPVAGLSLMMTHGHLQGVKQSLSPLICQAKQAGVDIVVYGHTHTAYLEQLPEGLWIMNPGAGGSYGGSVGLIEIENQRVTAARILRQEELEATL